MIYILIRFNKNKKNKTIKTNLTLEKAKQHCSKKDTYGVDWFDGFTKQ